MQTQNTLMIWLGEQAIPLAVISFILTVVLGTLFWSARSRRSRMNEERSEINEDTFVDELERNGFNRQIARACYRYLQERQKVQFPIRIDDRLNEDLGLDNAGIDQSIRELLSLTDRLYQPVRNRVPVVTVEDLVCFLQSSPRLSGMAA